MLLTRDSTILHPPRFSQATKNPASMYLRDFLCSVSVEYLLASRAEDFHCTLAALTLRP